MKKSITGVVALLAGAFLAHSQGTVGFANYLNGTSNYTFVSLKNGTTTTALGGAAAPTGVAATDGGDGNQWTVALYGATGSGDAAGTLAQLDTAGGTPVSSSLETGGLDTTPGTWLSTLIAVVPGSTPVTGTATVQVYAWYNMGGTYTTYVAAESAGVPTGFSTTATVTGLGGQGASGPPATAATLPTGVGGLGSFNVISTSTIP